MIASTLMPTTELMRLASAMVARRIPSVPGPSGTADIANTPSADRPVEITYHLRGESVMSTSGAQIHFSHCVRSCAPLRSAPSEIERPCCVARKVSATPTKPPSAPKGRYSTVQTKGCDARDAPSGVAAIPGISIERLLPPTARRPRAAGDEDLFHPPAWEGCRECLDC